MIVQTCEINVELCQQYLRHAERYPYIVDIAKTVSELTRNGQLSERSELHRAYGNGDMIPAYHIADFHEDIIAARHGGPSSLQSPSVGIVELREKAIPWVA